MVKMYELELIPIHVECKDISLGDQPDDTPAVSHCKVDHITWIGVIGGIGQIVAEIPGIPVETVQCPERAHPERSGWVLENISNAVTGQS